MKTNLLSETSITRFSSILRYFYLLGISMIYFYLSLSYASAQVPPIKNTTPIKTNPINNTKIKPINPNVSNLVMDKDIEKAYENYFSELNFSTKVYINPDCGWPQCYEWKISQYKIKDINSEPTSKNWNENLQWKKIPKNTVYGRWEISLLPFPPSDESNFSGIIRQGIIETKGADSINFNLNYSEVTYDNKRSKSNVETKKTRTIGVPNSEPTKSPYSNIKMNPELFSNFHIISNGERKFHIRIVPLDAQKKAIPKFSNDIIMQERVEKNFKLPPPKLNQDYVITNIKYVPVHFPDINYTACTIVTGYNENYPTFMQQFKDSFPIGASICPKPPKEKAWYEKAVGGVTGFVEKSIDGAARYYNETKDFFKDQFKNLSCGVVGGVTGAVPMSDEQRQTSDDACEMLSGTAFDYGMTMVGIPPSIPTTADLTKMAEGEIVDLACDMIESETGFPIPDEAREAIQEQTHQYLENQSKKGTIDGGFVQLKAHPLGLFQTAYLEIEVTRISKTSQEKGSTSFSISDKTKKNVSTYNKIEKKNETRLIDNNLFEPTSTAVPYLENIGDKTKLYVFLKPQGSYIHTDPNTQAVKSVDNYREYGVWEEVLVPTYEGYASSPGFQLLYNEGSQTNFSFGLKLADGVNSVFVNQ